MQMLETSLTCSKYLVKWNIEDINNFISVEDIITVCRDEDKQAINTHDAINFQFIRPLTKCWDIYHNSNEQKSPIYRTCLGTRNVQVILTILMAVARDIWWPTEMNMGFDTAAANLMACRSKELLEKRIQSLKI